MTLRSSAENAEFLFPTGQEEDPVSHLGPMRGASLRMMQTSGKAQQREENKWIVDDILSCRIKPHLKPVTPWTSHSCEPNNFIV